jgi:hypothetical protein
LQTAQAAEQTKVTTLQTALADLTARFDKINSACLDDGARRLASAPCGAISKVQTTKDAGTTSTTVEFAVTHEIVLNGMSAAQFQSDPSIVTSFRESAAALLGVDTNKIINIVATSTRRSLYSFHRLLAGESCRYVCFFLGWCLCVCKLFLTLFFPRFSFLFPLFSFL